MKEITKITLRELVEAYSASNGSQSMYLCYFIAEILGMDTRNPPHQSITTELKRVVSEHFQIRSNQYSTMTGWLIQDIGGNTDNQYIVSTITGMNISIEDPYEGGYQFRRWVLWFLYGAAPETVFSFEL